MSPILPSSAQDLHPHLHQLSQSSTIAALRHVRFRRPTIDHGKKGKKLFWRKKKGEELDGCEEKSEVSIENNADAIRRIGWKQRIKHFTWTWFAMNMATGGIANVMYVFF